MSISPLLRAQDLSSYVCQNFNGKKHILNEILASVAAISTRSPVDEDVYSLYDVTDNLGTSSIATLTISLLILQ